MKYLTPHLFLKWLVVDKIPFRILTRKRAIVSLGIKVRTASEKFGQIWTKEQMKDEGRWCSGFFLMKKIFSIKKIEKNLCRGFCRKNIWNYWAISSCFVTSLIRLLQIHNRIKWSHFLQVTILIVLVGKLWNLCSCMFIVWWEGWNYLMKWYFFIILNLPAWKRKRKRCVNYFY